MGQKGGGEVSFEKELREIALFHGVDAQIDQTIEECAELIVALRKLRRFGFTVEGSSAVAEEMADVRIMLDQLEFLLGETELWREVKVRREIDRIREAQQ